MNIEEANKIIANYGLGNHCDSIDRINKDLILEASTAGCGCCSMGWPIDCSDLEDYLEEAELRVAGIKKLIELLK